jgi:anti-sigma B factor antagonist
MDMATFPTLGGDGESPGRAPQRRTHFVDTRASAHTSTSGNDAAMLTDPRLTTRHHADYSMVTLRGEFDVASRDRLSEHLSEAMHASPAGTVLVDLAGVEFMDCTVLGVLVHAHRLATRQGLRMVLVRPTGAVRRLLEITRIDRAVPTRPHLQAALNAPVITLHTSSSTDRRFA